MIINSINPKTEKEKKEIKIRKTCNKQQNYTFKVNYNQ